MIKVLKKTADLLTLIADNQPVTFKKLQEATGWHKATLSVNLRSLVEIGFLEKLKAGGFVIGHGLQKLCVHETWLKCIERLVRTRIERLSAVLEERVVVATFHDGKRKVLAKFDAGIPSKAEEWVSTTESMLSTATGLVLLSYMKAAERDAFFRNAGIMEKQKKYDRKFQEIIDSGFCVEHYNGGETAAVAFPFSLGADRPAAAICVVLPECRLQGDKKKLVFVELRKCATQITTEVEAR